MHLIFIFIIDTPTVISRLLRVPYFPPSDPCGPAQFWSTLYRFIFVVVHMKMIGCFDVGYLLLVNPVFFSSSHSWPHVHHRFSQFSVGVPVPLAAGGRVAIVGQLLFAPWAWAYSALHSWMVGKWVPVITGKERQVCATLLGARRVPERLCGSCLVT